MHRIDQRTRLCLVVPFTVRSILCSCVCLLFSNAEIIIQEFQIRSFVPFIVKVAEYLLIVVWFPSSRTTDFFPYVAHFLSSLDVYLACTNIQW